MYFILFTIFMYKVILISMLMYMDIVPKYEANYI
jgi:hypothetical protein